MCLAGLMLTRITTLDVLGLRDGFKMCRVDAASMSTSPSADMVDLEPLGNWTDQQFVGDPVCECIALKLAVAMR